jgi:protein dithiol oxidoreductase (disulfide-forming)
MGRFAAALFVVLAFLAAQNVRAADRWVEGRDYVLLSPPQSTSVPTGKIEVMEVFSYGCSGCNTFQPVMNRLRHSLPANAQIVLLPASWNSGEDWPMFQRAFFTAQSLGIAERTHQGIFDAVWKTGELAVSDPATNRLKHPQPSLEDAARCYARISGVKPEAFLATANSFAIDMKMRAADKQIVAMQVPGTPCIVVNGKYRAITPGNEQDVIDLVRFLVSKASAR